ncbi:MAG: hypothetical protein GPOALKHO_000319 [Sodalis sp.]|nr:MAG: hypothetical protein GPOALKHO_000319 [Sodalis sp.]
MRDAQSCQQGHDLVFIRLVGTAAGGVLHHMTDSSTYKWTPASRL